MESLKKDNERLKRELELETRQARLTNSSAAALQVSMNRVFSCFIIYKFLSIFGWVPPLYNFTVQVSRMQLQSETYARKIEQERRRCDEYASQIAAARDTMYQMRRTQRGVNSVNEATLQVNYAWPMMVYIQNYWYLMSVIIYRCKRKSVLLKINLIRL